MTQPNLLIYIILITYCIETKFPYLLPVLGDYIRKIQSRKERIRIPFQHFQMMTGKWSQTWNEAFFETFPTICFIDFGHQIKKLWWKTHFATAQQKKKFMKIFEVNKYILCGKCQLFSIGQSQLQSIKLPSQKFEHTNIHLIRSFEAVKPISLHVTWFYWITY